MTATILSASLPGLVSLMWLVSALAKVAGPGDLVQSLREFGVPHRFAPGIAVCLPCAELMLTGLVIFPATRIAGLVASAAALALFSGLAVRVIHTGRAVSCNCFGSLTRAPVGKSTLVRNAILFGLVSFALVIARTNPSPPRGLTIWVVAALCSVGTIAALVVLTWAAAQNLQAHGALALRVAALEQGNREPDQQASLMTVNKAALTVRPHGWSTTIGEHLASRRKPTLLVALSDSCGPCRELLTEDVERWMSSRADVLVVVESGVLNTRQPTAPTGFEGPAMANVDPAWSSRAGLLGTPCAVVLDTSGEATGPPIYGKGEVQRRADEITVRPSPSGR